MLDMLYDTAVKSFQCLHCHKEVFIESLIGTANRNHCPCCLWSKHVDLAKSGDRKSLCQAGMEPIGLTFKQEGRDKRGNPRQGELMLIHQCAKDGKFSINRVAGDDDPEVMIQVFYKSEHLTENTKQQLVKTQILLLTKKDETEIRTQLYGKPI